MTAKFLSVAKKYIGLKEVLGKGSNATIDEWFKSFGYPKLKDDTAWCSLFANVVVREAGYAGTGSLAARSWLNWGKPLKNPVPGCIVVFKRGNSSWEGHVAFYVSETKTHIKVVGGNQSDQVSEASYPKSQLLGYRQPATLALSRTAVSAAGSGAAQIGAELIDTTTKVQSQVAGIPLEYAKYALVAISIALIFMTIYFKFSDIKKKG
jgi:uncharacterized protein (TIGR02594 family)